MTEYRHIKTGNIYLFHYFATNTANGEKIVVYQRKGTNDFYAREIKEFQAKFEFIKG